MAAVRLQRCCVRGYVEALYQIGENDVARLAEYVLDVKAASDVSEPSNDRQNIFKVMVIDAPT